MNFSVERLGDHDPTGFNSGNADLDAWLHRHARSATGHGTRTYVLVNPQGRLVGYFAIAPHMLDRRSAPRRLARGASGQIPAILLAKLALDETIQGTGMGSELLVHALMTIIVAASQAGGRVIIVEAIDENASAFYGHHDFAPLPDQPHRLVMKLSTAADALGLPWP